MKKLCDLEAEQAVLGAIIETPHILPEMPDALKPEAFGDPTHSILFKVIKSLEDDPVGINPLTVQGRMAQYPGIGELDVARYLGALGNAYLTMREDGVVRERGGVFGLAEVVVGLASRRAMLDAIERVGTMAQDLSIGIDDLRAVGTDALEAAGTGTSIAVQSIEDCLSATLERCEQIVAGKGPRGVKPDLQAWGDLVGPMMGGDMIVLGGATSMGKGQPLTSRVYTKSGWVAMGDVQVGMELASIDGRPSVVTGVFPQGERDVYEFTFRDGRKVRCDDSHLWKVWDWRRGWRVLNTLDLYRKLSCKTNTGRFYVPLFEGEWGDVADLPVDPYVLGCLLGDGGLTNGSVRISTKDEQILDEVSTALGAGYSLTKSGQYDYRIVTPRGQDNPLLDAIKGLGLHGVRSENKFIPEPYLHASREQRLALLQGLMDTDGSFCFTAEFSTSSPELADQFMFLVNSLGGSCSVRERTPSYTHNGEKRTGLTSYRIRVRHPAPRSLFRLSRKSGKTVGLKKAIGKLPILSIEKVGREPTQCIKVSHPDELYITDGFVVTHNTALAQQVALEIAAHGTVLVFSLEMSSGQWNDRYLAQITGVPAERIEMGPLSASDVEALKAARETLASRKLHVCDNPRLTVRGMKALCRRASRKYEKLDLVVIDHLQFIEHYDPRRDGPSKVADITREVKAMAKDLNVPIILVSHLNRDLAKRDGGRPQLSDLFGSSAIEKDADVVCFVHRENYWLSRQGPKPADDPFDEAEAEANRMMWEQALERTKHDAELIIAKRRRGAGAGYRKVRFLPERTLFMDPTPLDTRPAQAYQYERDDRADIWG
jgi:replicative DNA helicase